MIDQAQLQVLFEHGGIGAVVLGVIVPYIRSVLTKINDTDARVRRICKKLEIPEEN